MTRSTEHSRLTVAEIVSIAIFVLASGIWFGQYRLHGYQIFSESGQYLSPWLNLPVVLAGAALLSAFVCFLILHLPQQHHSRRQQ